MQKIRILIASVMVCFACLAAPGGAAAQSGQSTLDERPYDVKLLRLSEILGAVHYLRELCGAQEQQLWRKQMTEIMIAESSSAIRRMKFVKSFNKGYRGYRRTYRNCTQSAQLAIKRFMVEGAELSQTLLEENQ